MSGKASQPKEARDDGLSPKQRRFCLEYMLDLNGTQAAIRAGYSAGCASVTATRLLANAKIKAFLEPRMRRAEKRLELTAERLDEELARCAYLDPAQLIDPETGAVQRNFAKLPEDVRRAVRGLKIREEFDSEGVHIGDVVEVKLEPKVDAIKLAYQRKGLLKEKLEVTSTLDHGQLILLAEKLREKRHAGGKP